GRELRKAGRSEYLDARELLLLKALPAEDRAALGRPEGYRGFLAARRAVGGRFDPFPRHAPAAACRSRRAPPFAALAALWLVLEILVGEKVLVARRPHERRAAVHAIQVLVLELPRPLPLTDHRRARRAGDWTPGAGRCAGRHPTAAGEPPAPHS